MKNVLAIFLFLLAVALCMMGCPPVQGGPTAGPTAVPTPAPTLAPGNPKIMLGGVDTAYTLTTAVIEPNESSGSEKVIYSTKDAIGVLPYFASPNYENRCEILFSPAIDFSAYTTMTFKTNMSSNFINVNIVTDDGAGGSESTIFDHYPGVQTGWFAQSSTLATDATGWPYTVTWPNAVTKLVKKIEFYTYTATAPGAEAFLADITFN
jgi:hypothetical protein